MSPNKITLKQKIRVFFKRNLYPIVVSGSAFALAIALLATALVRNKILKEQEAEQNGVVNEQVQTPIDKAEASSPSAIVFSYPVKNYTLGSTYSDTNLVHNETLNEWTTHLGVDFIVADGTDVYPCYNGKVESVEYNTLEGTVVVIDHGDGLKTIYKSLGNGEFVGVGQDVTTSDVIGKASASATSEGALGAHVHLEVSENGTIVNPMNYLGEK